MVTDAAVDGMDLAGCAGFAAAAVAGSGWLGATEAVAPAAQPPAGARPAIALYFSRGQDDPRGEGAGLGTVGFVLYRALRAEYGQ